MAVKLSLLFMMLSLGSAFAQTGKWEGLNPYPADAYLYKIEPVTENVIYAGGLSGTIIKSTDCGESWKVSKINEMIAIRGISFTDSLNGLIIDTKHLYKTTNGGSDWQKISLNVDLSRFYLFEIKSFKNVSYLFLRSTAATSEGRIAARSLILKSTDYGNTWNEMNFEVKGILNSVYFINSNTGFFSTEESPSINELKYYLYKTTDGGTSWLKTQIINNPKCLYFRNESEGFGGRYRTTDGGLSWTDAFKNYLTSENLESIAFYDSLKGCAVTEQNLLETTDGGFTWTVKGEPALHVFTDVTYSKSGTAWAAGWGCDIRRKRINETGYKQLSRGNRNDLHDVFFIDKDEGWVSGFNGTILHTKDGGNNWEEQKTNLTTTLGKLKVLNHNEAWALGYNVVLNTTDGGINWIKRNDLRVWFPNIEFFDEDNGIIANADGNIYKTTNRGKDWTVMTGGSPFQYYFGSISVISKTEALVLAPGGILRITNKGNDASWYDVPEFSDIKSMQFVDSTAGFILTEKSKIFSTTDAGWTWKEIPRTEGIERGPINKLCMIDKTNGYIAWLTNYISRIKIDETVNIEEQDDYGVTVIYDFYFPDKDHGWAVGSDGNIIRYTNDNSTSVTKSNKKQAVDNSDPLSIKGSLIKFRLQNPQNINIYLYNSLGQRIYTIYQGWLDRGESSLQWKKQGLPAGMYFISAECEEFIKVQKSINVH